MKLPSSTQLHAYAQKAAGLVAIVLGSIHVALAADNDPIPHWETQTFAVFIFVTGALHLTGGTSLARVAAGELDTSSSSVPTIEVIGSTERVGRAVGTTVTHAASRRERALATAAAAAAAASVPPSTDAASAAVVKDAGAPLTTATAQVPTGTDGRPVADSPQA